MTLRNSGSIADLSISPDWRDYLDPSFLGSSLTEAIMNARTALLQGVEDYAALHSDEIENIDAYAVKKRIEDDSRELLSTSSFVAPVAIDSLVEEALQKADSLQDIAKQFESFAAEDVLRRNARHPMIQSSSAEVVDT